MAKAKKKRADKYDEKLAINGTFEDVIGVSVKNIVMNNDEQKVITGLKLADVWHIVKSIHIEPITSGAEERVIVCELIEGRQSDVDKMKLQNAMESISKELGISSIRYAVRH